MTNLKKEKVIGRARFLFYDLLGRYVFSDDDENRIIRCAADLSDCVKKSDENVTQTDLRNIEDMQAEINKLREVIKKQDEFIEHMWINHPIVRGHVTLLNKVHNARKALKGESEGK